MKWRLLLVSWVLAGCALPAAAQVPAGGEFRVNTYSFFDQNYPNIATTPDGGFIVAWADRGTGAAKVQRFDRAGNFLGKEFVANTDFDAHFPGLAVGSRGEFLVTWNQNLDGATTLQARLFDADGRPLGAELRVNSESGTVSCCSRVAADGRGMFIVTWWGPDISEGGIWARRFDARATPLGAEFLVNNSVFYPQFFQDVAADAAGNFVIAWTSRGGDSGDVMAQRYDPSGTPLGVNFRVNSYTTGLQAIPGLAYAPDGTFVVSYMSRHDGYEYDVFAKRYAGTGAQIGAEFQVNTYTPYGQGYPSVAMDGAGNFVVSWMDFDADNYDTRVRARRFRADGTGRGSDFLVSTATVGVPSSNRLATAVASDAVGNFVVDWVRLYPTAFSDDVYAQRFGGLHADALQVDGAGNQVWEPGETVDVAASWFNTNGAAQTIGGGLAALTGPSGPTYTISDGVAVYPTVADGARVTCSECYLVGVTSPPSRPATHWDATVVETLTPDALGQAKKWTLHIGRSFTDVPTTTPFYRFVETLLHTGVTAGCGPDTYCPASATSREQMAVFVLAAKEGSGYAPAACTTPVFGDVPASSPFCRFIEELARRGVVGGCGGGNFCPGSPVTREQMAVFTLRTLDPALDPPPCGTPVFADVPASSPFCRWVEELARRHVVAGCGGGNYCPGAPVTREQMGVFISVTFGLTLYGP